MSDDARSPLPRSLPPTPAAPAAPLARPFLPSLATPAATPPVSWLEGPHVALQRVRWGGRRPDADDSTAMAHDAEQAIRAFVATLYVPPGTAAALVEAYHLVREGRSANTLRAIESDLGAWSAWCRAASRVPLPARPEDVAAYLRDRAAVLAPATLRRHLSSIAWLHEAARFPSPTADRTVRLTLGATRRTWAAARDAAGQGTRTRQAPGLTARAVDAILATFGPGGPTRCIDRRDVALLLVARDLLARRSELVALRAEDVRPVPVDSVDVEPDAAPAADLPAGGATVLIRRSKTDQTGQGSVAYLGPETLAAVDRWRDAAAAAPGGPLRAGPLFRSVHVTGRLGGPLHPEDVADILRKLARRAAPQLRRLGVDPDAVSGHSCRVGMAQDLVAAGLELPAIMQAGRWKSSAMVARYAEQLLAAQGAIAQYHARRRRRA